MPVADAICSTGTLLSLDNGDTWVSAKSFASRLQDFKRVSFGTPPEAVALRLVGDYCPVINKVCGPQRLPFNDMWFEGDFAAALVGSERDYIAWDALDAWSARIRLAARVTNRSFLDPSTGQFMPNINLITFFSLLPDGTVTRFPVAVAVIHDKDGVIKGVNCRTKGEDGGWNEPDKLDDGMERLAMSMAEPVMWAIGLMNCKNVSLQEISREPITTKKQRRARNPGLRYNTIVLPNGQTTMRRPSDGNGERDVMPLHQVRGHFKTYTKDAPLLGQHTGTYWWEWQVRGNKANGEVKSDYRIELDDDDIADIKGKHDSGEWSVDDLAYINGVSKAAIRRALAS
jgi:hypothetical protein